MFVVTNRAIRSRKKGLDQFGKSPNSKGPNELRVFEATREGKKWDIDLLPDLLTREQKEESDMPVSKPAYSSHWAARKILDRVQAKEKNIVVFIHGFNNDLEAVLETADRFGLSLGERIDMPANNFTLVFGRG